MPMSTMFVIPPCFPLLQKARDFEHLTGDFEGFKIAGEATASRQAETACLLTSHLRRDAKRLPVLIGDQDAFDRMSIDELKKKLSRAV